MSSVSRFFGKAWSRYIKLCPDAHRIHRLLTERGETIVHDHVAFRTFNIDGYSKKELGRVFETMGYAKVNDDLTFPSKGLEASYYIHTNDPALPKIFISELLLEKFSPELQAWIRNVTSKPHHQHAMKQDALTTNNTDEGGIRDRDSGSSSSSALLPLDEDFFLTPPWAPVQLEDYQRFYPESEYAAWTAAFGIQVRQYLPSLHPPHNRLRAVLGFDRNLCRFRRVVLPMLFLFVVSLGYSLMFSLLCVQMRFRHSQVNHFAILVNSLNTFPSLNALNDYLTAHGVQLNTSGGVIKGNPTELLEQSSTMAQRVDWNFAGTPHHPIMGCYYEFAKRYPLPSGTMPGMVGATAESAIDHSDGRTNGLTSSGSGTSSSSSRSVPPLFQGFIPASADKIFESTFEKKT